MAAPLDRVKALLASLPREDQEALHGYLDDILLTPEEAEAVQVASLQETRRGKGGRQKSVTYTFRNEFIRCGKATCWCGKDGGRAGHGPYTYKYWKEEGRLRKQYVGRREAASAGATAPKRRGAAAAAGRARGNTAASSIGPAPPG